MAGGTSDEILMGIFAIVTGFLGAPVLSYDAFEFWSFLYIHSHRIAFSLFTVCGFSWPVNNPSSLLLFALFPNYDVN